MRTHKQFLASVAFAALLFAGFTAGSIAQDTTTITIPEADTPVILSTNPADGEKNVDRNTDIEITFSSVMDERTINGSTLLLHASSADSMHEMHGEVMPYNQSKERAAMNDSENSRQSARGAVSGTISYSDKVAVFTPDENLNEGTLYTFYVTKGVKNLGNKTLEDDFSWSFTTTGTSDSTYSANQHGKDMHRYGMEKHGMDRNEYSESMMDTTGNGKTDLIDLGKAGQFVILAKTTINNESESRIMGHTGEGSLADSLKKEREYTDSVQQRVPGQVLAMQSNKSDTTANDVSEAIDDMMSACMDASMQHGKDSTSHMNERFSDAVLTSGIYEWSDSLHIMADVTLSGGENDVWLFKVGDNLTVDENTMFTLDDGALAENIFWYVEGEVTIGRNAHFEGIILSMDEITLEKGATLNGRMFSQTSVTLNDNTVTEPGTMTGPTSSRNR